MSEILSAAGVKRVCMRYGGAEERGGINQVNFLSQMSGFLTYAEINKLRLPEAEVYALGEEMLLHCKADWLVDWGGQGELQWAIGGGVHIQHRDRRITTEHLNESYAEDRFSSVLEATSLPQSEAALIQCITASFLHEQGVLSLERIRTGEEDPSASPPLVDAARQLFGAVVQEALKGSEVHEVRGTISWALRERIDLDMEVDREVFEEMSFTIPDISVLSLPARAED